MIKNNNTQYMRKKISSTLLVFSAAIALLLASPLVFSNPLLLQPVQAQTTFTFKTPTPSTGNSEYLGNVTLTFQGHGTISPKYGLENLAGDYEIPNFQKGSISGGYSTNDSGRVSLDLILMSDDDKDPVQYHLDTACGVSGYSVPSTWSSPGDSISFEGPVECSTSSSQGGGNTASSPSQTTGTTTTTTKDSDGDGKPDSSDRCPHNSNPRCFKEGADTGSTTTQQQSSNRNGNQTRQ